MDPVLSAVNFPLFLTATLALLLVPGPVVLYIITRSVDQGRRAGFVSVLGLEIGNFFHVVAATLGLSAILLSSALAFNVVKYLGAAYLIYLGIRKLRSKDEIQEQVIKQDSLRRIFFQGILVAALNPKTALFFFAFLPQFVDSSKDATLQIMILGVIVVLMAIVTDSLYALMAGTVGGWLRRNLRYLRFQRLFSGMVYIGLGLTAAFADGKQK